MLDDTGSRRPPAVFTGGVALGAYRQLGAGPRGVAELGQAFIDAHGGDVAGALGQLLLRVDLLERRVAGVERPT